MNPSLEELPGLASDKHKENKQFFSKLKKKPPKQLDYLMQDAFDQNADSIVTFGSNQSNWCRMTSAAGSASEMEVHLILDGKEPDKPTGNLILDQLTGANIVYLDCEDDDEVFRYAMDYAYKLEASGMSPYFLPVGGSTPVGTLGYMNAFLEILQYCDLHGKAFDRIVVATGSAGTQAGLVAGQVISGWTGCITGISVGREREEQETMIDSLVRETLGFLNLSDEFPRDLVQVNDEYYGEGYRLNTREAGEAIKLFAAKEGIFLDEVYTGKAASGLLGMIEKGEIADNERILFIHTGGAVQLFE